MRQLVLLVGTLLLLFPQPGPAQAAAPAAYVALGDSLAAGQTPDRAIDLGYADMIAMKLRRHAGLAFYSKDLSYPGFTSGQVLERVRSDEARPVLERATLITVSAGANDLLGLVRYDPGSGTLAYDRIPADYALDGVRKNVSAILDELAERAPRAKIYIMGYYFPYPHAREQMKPGLRKELGRLNAILKQEAESAGAVFVPVKKAFAAEDSRLLPNPSDVHPSLEGYRRMANAFFEHSPYRLSIQPWEVPPANPVSFGEMNRRMKQADGRSADAGDELPFRMAIDEQFQGIHAIYFNPSECRRGFYIGTSRYTRKSALHKY
ncbi:Lysophospholipase L1 [Bhargavaea beijingensis]|uniref:Lysophospholipase L1 n=1 Tax=Bhargavaea beijingensis TaxID=426756 RepID=A0A1G7BCF9_9BACL|nr:SGNH/GDSL hydrolase family protein [Bhargavaea beijingensis]SDE23915.1 Lysophospholipase L1 [Bhargavaea beijingensis]